MKPASGVHNLKMKPCMVKILAVIICASCMVGACSTEEDMKKAPGISMIIDSRKDC